MASCQSASDPQNDSSVNSGIDHGELVLSSDDADADAEDDDDDDDDGEDDDEGGNDAADDGHGSRKAKMHRDMSKEQDKVDEIVGVSLGRAQDRFKSRSIPREEKTCMLEDDFEGHCAPVSEDAAETSDGAGAGLYLPEIRGDPGPRKLRKAKDGKRRDSDQETSSRASSAPVGREEEGESRERGKGALGRSSLTRSILRASPRDVSPNLSSLKRFLPTNFSVRPRSLSFRLGKPRFDSAGHSRTSSRDSRLQQQQQQQQQQQKQQQREQKQPPPRRRSSGNIREPHKGQDLRRTASDQSLYLTNSLASNLEGIDRYENVHSQVNIRFKAIMDTLHDNSKGLLSIPSLHLPDFHFSENSRADPMVLSQGGEDNQSFLSEALSCLTGNVVVMGGYRGTVLRSAQPPHRQMWIPMKASLNLRKVDIQLGLSAEDDEHARDTIIPGEILSHVGPVDVCRKLIRKLQKCDNATKGDLQVSDFGYDWRLNPLLLADELVAYLEGLPCNNPALPPEKRGAYVIAHSLGGLVARHAVNQRPDLFAGVVYAGTPRHCVNILGPLRTGEDVLLNSRVLTAQVSFTFRTSFALLPESGRCFFNGRTGERYNVDFFSPKTWDEYRLSPVVRPPLPALYERSGLMENIPILGKHFLGSKDDDAVSENSAVSGEEIPTMNNTSSSSSSLQRQTLDPADGQRGKGNRRSPSPAVTPPVHSDSSRDDSPSSGTSGETSSKANSGMTITPEEAMKYLDRVLPEVLRFKQELAFNSTHQSENRYPPFAVLYGRSTPTVYGARVSSREQIKHEDAYDDLAFAAGDGVVLASASMLPPSYRIIKGGLVESERGHVSLLGDLEGVGKCLLALVKGRKEGVGLGQGKLRPPHSDSS